MSRFEIVIDEIVLEGVDIRREPALRDAIQAAVSRSLAGAPVSARPMVAAQVARSVASAVVSRGDKP